MRINLRHPASSKKGGRSTLQTICQRAPLIRLAFLGRRPTKIAGERPNRLSWVNEKLDPRVVVGEHGWWQGCKELGIQGYDPFSPDGANFNRTIDASDRDPVGGTPGHRANLCQISLSLAAPADRQ